MIARQWRGLARVEYARQYQEHLFSETFPALESIEGFVDASVLTRTVEKGIEFLVVTRWRSLEAIARFSGSDTEAAIVPEKVRRMMVDFDLRVLHYEVVKGPNGE